MSKCNERNKQKKRIYLIFFDHLNSGRKNNVEIANNELITVLETRTTRQASVYFSFQIEFGVINL